MYHQVVQGKFTKGTTLNGEESNNESSVGSLIAWLEQKLHSFECRGVLVMWVSFPLLLLYAELHNSKFEGVPTSMMPSRRTGSQVCDRLPC